MASVASFLTRYNHLLKSLSCPYFFTSITHHHPNVLPPRCSSFRFISYRERRMKASEPLTTKPVSIIVAGNDAHGNGRSVFLTYDDNYYLFNCSEGTQRIAYSNKFKLNKLKQTFTTSHSWQNASGLFGLALSCYDAGLRSLSWHGLESMKKLLKLCTYFDFKLKKSMQIICFEVGEEAINDGLLQINAVVMKDGVEKPVIAYFCKLKSQKGVFRIDKCFELNVPRILVSKLQAGEDLVLDDGRVVKAKDVFTCDEQEQTVIVLECPSFDHIDSIVNHKQFSKLIQQSSNISAIVHFTPNFIANDIRYQDWINNFPITTKHIMINKDNPSFCVYQMYRFQVQLNLLDDSMFPLLKEYKKEISCDTDNVIHPYSGMELLLRPHESNGLIKYENPLQINIEEIQRDCFEREGFVETHEKLKSDIKTFNENNKCGKYPEVVFFGTGSALPGIARNVSSILVNTNNESSILLECGEDTVGQIYRFYGVDKMESVLSKIKAVFISHIHSDHHFGLVCFLKERYNITGEAILLILPPLLLKWLQTYSNQVEDISMTYHFKFSKDLTSNNRKKLEKDLGLTELMTVPVSHCKEAHGISLITSDNRKIVFSGDAVPSQTLIDAGQDCDLLIHEATMEDALVKLAQDMMHSTFSQAIDVGKRMNSKFTILTHFSQRYSKMPLLPEEIGDNVGVAFDNMRVSLDELPKLSLIIPALKCLYAKHLDNRKVIEEINKRKLSIES